MIKKPKYNVDDIVFVRASYINDTDSSADLFKLSIEKVARDGYVVTDASGDFYFIPARAIVSEA